MNLRRELFWYYFVCCVAGSTGATFPNKFALAGLKTLDLVDWGLLFLAAALVADGLAWWTTRRE